MSLQAELHHHMPVTSPRTYRVSFAWRAFLLLLCAVLGIPAAIGIWYFGSGHDVRSTTGATILITACAFFVLLCGWLATYMFVSQVTLWRDRIEVRGLIRTSTLSFNDIDGRRLVHARNSPANIIFVPRRREQKKLQIAKMYNFDAVFYEWLRAVPDLDERDALEAEEEIANNAEIGATPDERMEALKRGKRVSGFMNAGSVLLALWAWIYPAPYNWLICTLAILPWIAIAIVTRSGGLFRLDAKNNDPHPNLCFPFMMPGIVLALRVVFDINLLTWKEPLSFSIAISLLLTVAAVAADQSLRNRYGMALLIFVLSIAYGFGVSMGANALLDHSPSTVYKTPVMEKRVSHGRHTSYDLYLAPWGPKDEKDSVSVSRRFYYSVRQGDSVCVLLREGAFNVQWYTVRHCQ